jgi:putative hydrolase of the HAD superfamily
MHKTFVFDYDDTLAANQHDYTGPQLEFFEWVIGRLGYRAPDVQSLANLEAEVDSAGVKTHGFTMERFPSSFQEVYTIVAKKFGITPTPEELEHVYSIGMKAYDVNRYRAKGLLEGVPETLDFLVRQQDELVLLTKGDPRVQNLKIDATGVRKWFGDRIHIVLKKDKAVVEHVVGNRDKARVWHVGNSIRSDVTPALEAGIGMVYVPCETWAYEREHKGLPVHPRLLRLDRVEELLGHYGRLP